MLIVNRKLIPCEPTDDSARLRARIAATKQRFSHIIEPTNDTSLASLFPAHDDGWTPVASLTKAAIGAMDLHPRERAILLSPRGKFFDFKKTPSGSSYRLRPEYRVRELREAVAQGLMETS